MIDVLGVLYCVCIVLAIVALVLVIVALVVEVVVDVVEHFQFKRQIKIIKRLEEMEGIKNNENRA